MRFSGMNRLQDKAAIVTGATSGMGRAMPLLSLGREPRSWSAT
jgi:hypothetical protein